eukprot:1498898-Pleurochrysis_carterae.AAC.2
MNTVRGEENTGEDERPRLCGVDDESAYKFCPLQRAEWWLQCFVWWVGDGSRAGIVVDMMWLGFGGAYAPNRFELVSTLVAASIQEAQRKFAAAQPPPTATRCGG